MSFFDKISVVPPKSNTLLGKLDSCCFRYWRTRIKVLINVGLAFHLHYVASNDMWMMYWKKCGSTQPVKYVKMPF